MNRDGSDWERMSRHSCLTAAKRLGVALLFGLMVVPVAQAIDRHLPADARRAVLTPPYMGVARLDGEPVRLAPGAQIRDGYNRIVLPASLTRAVLVKYRLNAQGALYRAWILTAEEAARPDPEPKK